MSITYRPVCEPAPSLIFITKIHFGLQWNVSLSNTEWQLLKCHMVVWSDLSVWNTYMTAYITCVWTQCDLWLLTGVVLSQGLCWMHPRMLLLWSVKAKRECSGMQRQLDVTLTLGYALISVFYCLHHLHHRYAFTLQRLQVWGRGPT